VKKGDQRDQVGRGRACPAYGIPCNGITCPYATHNTESLIMHSKK